MPSTADIILPAEILWPIDRPRERRPPLRPRMTPALALSGPEDRPRRGAGNIACRCCRRRIEISRRRAGQTARLKGSSRCGRTMAARAPKSYRPNTRPGVYAPTTVPLFSTVWRNNPLDPGERARNSGPGPPPALDSETWTRDVNEIRELGARNSAIRTPEQTTIGPVLVFRRCPYLQSDREAGQRWPRGMRPRGLRPAVRVDYSMAGNDALVAVFDAKYTYNLWRPITAIRNADTRKIRQRRAMPRGCHSVRPRCIPSIRVRTASPRLRSLPFFKLSSATSSARFR